MRVAVIGAGISGLVAARAARKAGHEVVVFDGADEAGGVIRSERVEGWLVERGPQTMQETPAVAALIAELGLTRERVVAGGGASLKRYVLRDGRLRPLPLSPRALLTSGFFSWKTKFKIIGETRARRVPRAGVEPSFSELVRCHFGEEALTYAAQPFVSGVYAGDAEKLSAVYAFPKVLAGVKATGSIIKGQMAARSGNGPPALISFRDGLQSLPRALARDLAEVRLNAPVKELTRDAAGWRVNGESATYDEIILTLPAFPAAEVAINGARPLAFLRNIPHPPVTSLTVGFVRSEVRHALDGFGLLVPAVERRSVLGIIFTSTLFPDRAPAGHVALTVMMGGSLNPSMAKPTADGAWSLAAADVQSILGIKAKPAFLTASHYPAAIPQYNLGYAQILETISNVERSLPGLILEGSYKSGIGLPDRLIASSLRSRH